MNQDLVRQQPGALADPGQQSDDIVTYARWVVESGLFGRGITQAQAGLKMLVGRELGIQPLAAVRNIYIFEADGRPVVVLDATLMGAMIRASGRYDYDVERSDETGTILAMYRVEPAMPRQFLGRESFTLDDARRRKLTEKRGPWTQGYAKEMMFARCMSRLIDHYAPDLLLGLSLPVVSQDEAEEMPMGHDQRKAIFANLKEVGVESREQRLQWASDVLRRDVPTFSDGNPGCPTRAEASRLLDWFDREEFITDKAYRVAGADEPEPADGKSSDWVPAPAAAPTADAQWEWSEPEGAGEEASPGAGDATLGEVQTLPAPAEQPRPKELLDAMRESKAAAEAQRQGGLNEDELIVLRDTLVMSVRNLLSKAPRKWMPWFRTAGPAVHGAAWSTETFPTGWTGAELQELLRRLEKEESL